MKKVLVLDFGGQYNLLVARRVRECGVYCEIKPYTMSMDDIRAFDPAAIIFTGGPATVFEPNAPALDNAIFELGLPILGICYGQQLMIHQLGGACRRAEVREYGKVELTHDGTSLLFDGVEPTSICWMSHGVEVERLSPGFRAIAHTAGCAYAAIENADRKLYGVQFHPEVLHTVHGTEILKDFLYKVCGLAPEWSMANYVSEAIEEVRAKVGSGKVLRSPAAWTAPWLPRFSTARSANSSPASLSITACCARTRAIRSSAPCTTASACASCA